MATDVLTEPTGLPTRQPGGGAAILALVLALVGTAFLMLIIPVRTCSFAGSAERCVIQWDTVLRTLAVAALGLVASAVPVVALRSTRAVGLRTASAVALGFVASAGLLIPPGLLFLPSAIAMSVSAIQSRRAKPARSRIGGALAWISLALAFAAGVALLFISSGERCVSRAGSGVAAEETGTICTSTTLLESEGSGIIGILLFPVAVTAVPVVAGRHRSARPLRAISATVLMALSLLGMLSIGVFYVPAMLAMVAAASFEPGSREARTRGAA